MKAARFYAAHDIRVEDIPRPTPQPGQVLIDVEWCGICGSDLHEYLHGPVSIPARDQPHALTGEHLPIVMGHEFCGRVSAVPVPDDRDGGNWKTQLRVGQKVMVDPRLACRKCRPCRSEGSNTCDTWGFLGLSGLGGGLAEKVVVDARMCHVLPDEIDLRCAALIEPLAVARRAVRTTGIATYTNMSVLVLGGGPIGLAVLLDLKSIGVKQIIVSEPSETRQRQVHRLADAVLDPRKIDVPAECRRRTDGVGVDIVFDCAGVVPAFEGGVDALRIQGTYMNVAAYEVAPTLPIRELLLKEIVLRGSFAYDERDFKEVIRKFVEGKYGPIESLVTARIVLDEVVQGGFEQLVKHKDDHIKIMVTPKPELLKGRCKL